MTPATTKKTTLADVAADVRAWADTLEGLEGAEHETALVEAATAALQGKEKTERFCRFLQWANAQAAFLKSEADALARKAKALENAVERLKQYAYGAMKANEVMVLEGITMKMRRQGAADKIIIDNEDIVPSTYRRLTLQVNAAQWEAIVGAIDEAARMDFLGCFEMKANDISKTALHAAFDEGLAAVALRAALRADAGEEPVEETFSIPGARLEKGENLVIR